VRFPPTNTDLSFHWIKPRSHSELISETMNPFRHFVRIPWTGDRPIARPLRTQNSITQKNADKYPCLDRDSNPLSQCLSVLESAATGTGQLIFVLLIQTSFFSRYLFIGCSILWTPDKYLCCLCLIISFPKNKRKMSLLFIFILLFNILWLRKFLINKF
jgi:hypothetical protein